MLQIMTLRSDDHESLASTPTTDIVVAHVAVPDLVLVVGNAGCLAPVAIVGTIGIV